MQSKICSNQQLYRVVGLMSGTSLDGLDICLCNFVNKNDKWEYKIDRSITISYPEGIKANLIAAFNYNGAELTKFDYTYGMWVGNQVKEFLREESNQPDFIASHGHTIFHKPDEGYTLQIGKGSAIASLTGLPCICDFRSSDVCKGGQGAPLVPIGDRILFSEFNICLNLGGFSNLSYESKNSRLAFDIGPCNIILNHLASKFGLNYDKNGDIGRKGSINSHLLDKLNNLDYYKQKSPKSLGREWIEDVFLPIIDQSQISFEDKLRTVYEHIAVQTCIITNSLSKGKILATGGGAHNSLLIHLLEAKSNSLIIVPDKHTVDYKEALIFAFLGVLHIKGMPSALSSVTGACSDSISGCLYY